MDSRDLEFWWQPGGYNIYAVQSQAIHHCTCNLKMVSPGTLIFTDEYSIYARLTQWEYGLKTVNHGQGEYTRSGEWKRVLRIPRQHFGKASGHCYVLG